MSIKKIVSRSGVTQWEVRVHESGRGSKRLKRKFTRKADAEAFLDEFKSEMRAKAKSPFKGSSFEDRLFKDEAKYWLDDGKLRFSASHLKRVEGILSEILPKFGELTLDKFTPELISRYQQEESARGLKPATTNRKTEVLTAILNCSTKHRRIPFNPSVGFRKLKKSSAEMSFWSEAEASSFLTEMDRRYPEGSSSRWIYVVYLLALNTGLRAGEIWGFQPCDIPHDGKSLWIRRQFNRVSLTFTETKGKKARHVPCLPDLLHELKALIARERIKHNETIFRNAEGLPVCHDNFSDRVFAKDLKAWGGRTVRFHDLRHTATTLMISKGIDLKTVKEICGHADIATTMNYVHLVAGSVERVTEVFSIKPVRVDAKIINMSEAESDLLGRSAIRR